MQLVFYSMIQFTMQLIRSNGGCPPLLKSLSALAEESLSRNYIAGGWGEVKKTLAIEARVVVLNYELILLYLERVLNRVFRSLLDSNDFSGNIQCSSN